VWIRDLVRGVSSRFTFRSGNNGGAVWSADGSSLAFMSINAGAREFFQKPSGGQGEEVPLLKQDDGAPLLADWSRDGRYFAYVARSKDTGLDVWALPTFGDRKPIRVTSLPFDETVPVFSPDGRYIAYRSAESGRPEIYVQTFPEPSGKWQVSIAGGNEPHWRADGKELYFRGLDQKLMAVEIQTQGGFQAGTPVMLFPASTQAGAGLRNRFVPAPAGDRFVVVSPQSRESIGPTTVVLNWDAGLNTNR
jgi:Tol biopolymer transport system component